MEPLASSALQPADIKRYPTELAKVLERDERIA